MTSYLGGKFRIGKEISEIINKEIEKQEKALAKNIIYLEPFCGMASVGKRIRAKKKLFSDSNNNVIIFWKAIKNGWKPNTTRPTEEEYLKLKMSKTTPQKIYTGYRYGYAGRYFDKLKPASGTPKPFNLKFENLKNSYFSHRNYDQWIPHGKIIYCDPPYASTTKQKSWEKFDHAKFWRIIKKWSLDNIVFVSETANIEKVSIVWNKDIKRSIGARNVVNEKLYRLGKLI